MLASSTDYSLIQVSQGRPKQTNRQADLNDPYEQFSPISQKKPPHIMAVPPFEGAVSLIELLLRLGYTFTLLSSISRQKSVLSEKRFSSPILIRYRKCLYGIIVSDYILLLRQNVSLIC